MTDSPTNRTYLAGALRTLRVGAGLSTTQLANRLGWSQSKVSRIELGHTLARPDDVTAWTSVTKAEPAHRDDLVRIARRTAAEFTEWRQGLAPGRRRVQEEIQRLEESASIIRVFAPRVVVGLAQTPAYAEAVFRLGRPRVGPSEKRDDIVRARLARQTVLDDRTKHFYLLMGEATLRRQLVTPPQMLEQIVRLAALSERPNITMGIIPFSAVERVHQYHGFSILGDPKRDYGSIVLAETVTRAINIRSSDEIAEYITHFEALRSAALEGEQLRAFLRGTAHAQD